MKKELYGILLFFLIVFTTVSLLTYDSADPCTGNHFFTLPDQFHNAFGMFGAHLSGFFIYLFGLGAYWVPVILCCISIWGMKGRSGRILGLTVLGGLFLMISTGAIFYLFKNEYFVFGTTVTAGGVVGKVLTGFLLKYANIFGGIIILVFLFVVGTILATGISLVSAWRFIKKKSVEFYAVVLKDMQEGMDHINDLYAKWKKKREAQKKQIDITPDPAEEKEILIKLPEPEVVKAPEPIIAEPVLPVFNEPSILEVELDDTEFIPDMGYTDVREKVTFKLPKISFLDEKKKVRKNIDAALLKEKSRILQKKLSDFNVSGEVIEILPGPVITTFEYMPAPGIKISKIKGLSDDLALALSAISIRIVGPIPGRNVVGIEIPNEEREMVNLRELVTSKEFVESASLLTLGLGKDLLGKPMVTKMDSMPHLLIAGATGTGKSVGLNSMIISLLYKGTPDEIKMIMIDPKRIELSVYNDIPHLISPVVTDMKKATNALFWAVREMERRYELLEETGLRNIIQFNEMVASQGDNDVDEQENGDITAHYEKLPYIVVIVDELADLMMVSSKEVEHALARLAQMARAAGIHLIVATQRPSADILTGSIKANFPSRISFQVSSKIDGRIIIDGGGGENLLGNGDMLFCPPGTSKAVRIQGAYISEKEIAKITKYLKDQREPEYLEDVTNGDVEEEAKLFDDAEYDEKYDEAVALVTESRQASISYVQRRMRIGYNRAARLVEMMEHEGIVGPQIGSKPREILVKSYDDI